MLRFSPLLPNCKGSHFGLIDEFKDVNLSMFGGGGPCDGRPSFGAVWKTLELNHSGVYVSRDTLPHNHNDTVQMPCYLLIEWRNFIIHTRMTLATETRPWRLSDGDLAAMPLIINFIEGITQSWPPMHGRDAVSARTLPSPTLQVNNNTLPSPTLPFLTLPSLTLPFHTLPFLTLPFPTLPFHPLFEGLLCYPIGITSTLMSRPATSCHVISRLVTTCHVVSRHAT